MEGRMNRCRQISPDRAKVWTEKPKNYVQHRKVSVLYYLCKDHQLGHPHFVQVKLSSSRGLYLRDFINRLSELRRRVMPARYSWSYKRSYKTGFVWHDLSQDDLIHPASGNEYVLKGSEIFEDPISDQKKNGETIKYQSLKRLPELTSYRSQDDSSSCSSMKGKERSPSIEDAYSPLCQSGSCGVSPEYRVGTNASPVGNLSLVEYKVYKCEQAADASTQTEENAARETPQETCTRGVSMEDGSLSPILQSTLLKRIQRVKENAVVSWASGSPPSCTSESLSARKTETLESLIRADAKKKNSFRNLEREDISMSSTVRLKTTNMLMQLISCGSIAVKDHSLGLIPANKLQFSGSKFPSPLYSTSILLGELDYMTDNPRKTGRKFKDDEYFSSSLIETLKLKQIGGLAALKRSSSFGDWISEQSNAEQNEDTAASVGSKCIPLSIKASIMRQPRSESLKSSLSDKLRISSDCDSSRTTTPSVSVGSSKRIVGSLADKMASRSPNSDSFRDDYKISKIEERLASGARIIIQSKSSSSGLMSANKSSMS